MRVMSDIVERLKAVVGEKYVSDSPVERVASAGLRQPTMTFYPRIPDIVVMPQSTEQVSRILSLANRTKVPVVPKAAGSAQFGTNVPFEGGILLDLTLMNKILDIDEENMVVTAEAGCSIYKVINECWRRDLFLPIGPEFQSGPQIGANLATNITGHFVARTGRLGDLVVGIEVVLPTGEIVTLGSGAYKRGYGHYYRYIGGPDVMGLFINAGGTTGVITKVAFRLLQKPAEMAYISYAWPRDKIQDVAKAHYELQRYANILNIHLWNRIVASGFAAGIPVPKDAEFIMNINQNAASKEELEIRERRVREICEKYGGTDLGDFWKNLAGPPGFKWFTMYAGHWKMNLERPGCAVVPEFYNPTLKFPEIYELTEKISKKYSFGFAWMSWAEKNVMAPYPVISFDPTKSEEVDRMKKWWKEYNLELVKRGCAQYLAGAHTREALEELGPNYELIKRMKKLLDPNNILNPGVLF